eukprot:SAG22_NODE_7034_length_783_cov_1.390351_2_plen_104_part_00
MCHRLSSHPIARRPAAAAAPQDCIFCHPPRGKRTNLCPKIRATQGAGTMPDGTVRFTGADGADISHFMGCSTFSEYTVLAAISCAKISPTADLQVASLLGCGA